MTQNTSTRIDRRRFLRQAAAGGLALGAAPYVITSTALGAAGAVPASDRIAMGFIGVGSHGIGRNLKMFLRQADAEPVALCDVDTRQIDKALQTVRGTRGDSFSCQTTQDWREVIAREDIDGIMISTPDHWHVPIALAALRSGKDVICEKPTLTIAEGRLLADTVKQRKAVFQTSTEDRSMKVYHRMAELVRIGRIGKLERILVQLPAGPGQPGDATPQPVPPELDYEMWLGPAPRKPYCPARLPYQWRWVRDYSGGQLTDWGAHQIDTAQLANNTERTGPVSVEGHGRRHHGGLYDTYYDYHLTYKFANGVEMCVDSGGTGLRFEGSDGWIGNVSFGEGMRASSDEILHSEIGPDETRIETCFGGEHRNFLDCVKSRGEPYFPAEVGHRCSTISHMGNICMDLGRKLQWNPDSEEFVDDAEANAKRTVERREPWGLG